MPSHTTSSREELANYVDELHAGYEVWYAKSVRRLNHIYGILQLTAVISGFAASILGGLMDAEAVGTWRFALILVPAVGSIAATALVQFNVQELWKLREQGRIRFQDLVVSGRRALAAAKSEEECAQVHADLQEKAMQIEQAQSERFFGHLNKTGTKSSDSVAGAIA